MTGCIMRMQYWEVQICTFSVHLECKTQPWGCIICLRGSKMRVCKASMLCKYITECQKGGGRSFSVSLSCPLFTSSCHFSSASPPCTQFLSLRFLFSCGNPKICCHKKGTANLCSSKRRHFVSLGTFFPIFPRQNDSICYAKGDIKKESQGQEY